MRTEPESGRHHLKSLTFSNSIAPNPYMAFLILGLLLVPSLAGCSRPEQNPSQSPSPTPSSSDSPIPSNEGKSSVLEKYRIGLDYPPTWKPQDREIESPLLLNSIEVVDLSPETNGTVEEDVVIKVVLEFTQVAMSLEQFHEEVALKKLTAYGQKKLEAYGNIILEDDKISLEDGRPAYKIVYSRYDGENNVKGMIILTMRDAKDNLVYVLHYTADLDNYEKYLSEVEVITNSLKFL